jgi:hypothetical protein
MNIQMNEFHDIGICDVVCGLHMKGGGLEWGCGGVWKDKWELWGLRRHDELMDMVRFVPMRKEVY